MHLPPFLARDGAHMVPASEKRWASAESRDLCIEMFSCRRRSCRGRMSVSSSFQNPSPLDHGVRQPGMPVNWLVHSWKTVQAGRPCEELHSQPYSTRHLATTTSTTSATANVKSRAWLEKKRSSVPLRATRAELLFHFQAPELLLIYQLGTHLRTSTLLHYRMQCILH